MADQVPGSRENRSVEPVGGVLAALEPFGSSKKVGIGATTHHASSCDELPDDAFVGKSGAGGIRTPVPDSSSHEQSGSCETCEIEVAHIAAQLKSNPHLRKLIDTWSELPEPVRAGIIAMVEAASPRGT